MRARVLALLPCVVVLLAWGCSNGDGAAGVDASGEAVEQADVAADASGETAGDRHAPEDSDRCTGADCDSVCGRPPGCDEIDVCAGASCSDQCAGDSCSTPKLCASSKECGSDEVCDKQAGVCVQCVEDADCPDGFRCAQHLCEQVLPCISDKECKAYDKVCSQELGECVDCASDVDCADGESCKEWMCVNLVICEAGVTSCIDLDTQGTCSQDGTVLTPEPCPEGQKCNPLLGHCVPGPG